MYQIWGSVSRGFDHLGNSSSRNEVPGIEYIHTCKFHIVPAGRDFGRRRVDPTKPSMETRRFVRYLGVFVVQGKKLRQLWGWGVNTDRAEVLMSGETRSRDFRIRNGSWRQVHHHRVGGGVGKNIFGLGGNGG